MRLAPPPPSISKLRRACLLGTHAIIEIVGRFFVFFLFGFPFSYAAHRLSVSLAIPVAMSVRSLRVWWHCGVDRNSESTDLQV